MALAGSWSRAWGWQAVGRSAPILTGFVWEGNVPPALTGGNVGGQILARDERFPLLFFFSYFFSSLWFSWLQIKHSDSCLWEERRSSVGIAVDRHGVKNIIAAGKSPVKQRCSQSTRDFLGSCIKGFLFFPCHVFYFMKSWDFRSRQLLGGSPKAEGCFAALISFYLGLGEVLGVQMGTAMGLISAVLGTIPLHRPLPHC